MAPLINVMLLVAFSVCVSWSMPAAGARVGVHAAHPAQMPAVSCGGRVCNCSVVRCSMGNIKRKKKTNVYKNKYIF